MADHRDGVCQDDARIDKIKFIGSGAPLHKFEFSNVIDWAKVQPATAGNFMTWKETTPNQKEKKKKKPYRPLILYQIIQSHGLYNSNFFPLLFLLNAIHVSSTKEREKML